MTDTNKSCISSDLIFSIVSSGIGATVCTAGRFLLVAPLTKDEEDEEEEDAESVAPGQSRETSGREMKNKTKVIGTPASLDHD